ncbi:DUF47 domain-containing protein [Conexibacter sp. S30A1]|jgi:hypothetical protein|uniref:DUF47 domain-containing protein n=1 Tax=Conexibacter sp. S30A1 TaxID=2937800 RepID=UPI00200D410C|nr:DUF47 family protein [Conexibacter sp. S30A1]
MNPPRANPVSRGVVRLARDLTGRSTGELVALLEDQLDATEQAAQLVVSLAAGAISADEAHVVMRELEHDGDGARAQLVLTLAKVLTTPIDAEDMFRLSRSIDDVLDNLRDFVREATLYRPESLAFATELSRILVDGLGCLKRAVAELGNPRGKVRHETLATRKAASQVRRLYQEQVGALLNTAIDNETLKHRELLRRLDVVGLRLGEAADALADGALKRSR